MDAGEPSLAHLVQKLADDAREVATAEVAVHRARLVEKIGRYKVAAIYFSIAGVLGLAALFALLVGLIMTLTPLVGPGFATLIIVGLVLLIAAVLGMIGKSKLSGPLPSPDELPQVTS